MSGGEWPPRASDRHYSRLFAILRIPAVNELVSPGEEGDNAPRWRSKETASYIPGRGAAAAGEPETAAQLEGKLRRSTGQLSPRFAFPESARSRVGH
jgi:hypothetical protein